MITLPRAVQIWALRCEDWGPPQRTRFPPYAQRNGLPGQPVSALALAVPYIPCRSIGRLGSPTSLNTRRLPPTQRAIHLRAGRAQQAPASGAMAGWAVAHFAVCLFDSTYELLESG